MTNMTNIIILNSLKAVIAVLTPAYHPGPLRKCIVNEILERVEKREDHDLVYPQFLDIYEGRRSW